MPTRKMPTLPTRRERGREGGRERRREREQEGESHRQTDRDSLAAEATVVLVIFCMYWVPYMRNIV